MSKLTDRQMQDMGVCLLMVLVSFGIATFGLVVSFIKMLRGQVGMAMLSFGSALLSIRIAQHYNELSDQIHNKANPEKKFNYKAGVSNERDGEKKS